MIKSPQTPLRANSLRLSPQSNLHKVIHSPQFPQTVYHLLDTMQIQSRHRLILALILDFSSRYSTNTIKTQINYGIHSIFHLLDTVQIQSRHRLILALILDFSSRYNTDIIKTQIYSGTHSIFLFEIQFRYDPDTYVILILIQMHLSDTI